MGAGKPIVLALLALSLHCATSMNFRRDTAAQNTAIQSHLIRVARSSSGGSSSSGGGYRKHYGSSSSGSDSSSSHSSSSDSSSSGQDKTKCWYLFCRRGSRYSYLSVPSHLQHVVYLRTEKECRHLCESTTEFRCSRYNYYQSPRSSRYNMCMLLKLNDWNSSYKLRSGSSVKYWKYMRNTCRITCDHNCHQPCVREGNLPPSYYYQTYGAYGKYGTTGDYVCPKPCEETGTCNCDNACDASEICNEDTQVCEKTCTESTGSDFTLMFTENRNVNDDSTPALLEVYVASADGTQSAAARVYTPNGGITGCFIDQTRNIPLGTVERFVVPSCLLAEGTGRTLNTVKVEGVQGNDLVVYGVNKKSFTTDGFLAFPDKAVGRQFVAVGFGPPFFATQIGLIALSDDTRVTVTLSATSSQVVWDGVQRRALETFDLTLNQFEAAQLQSFGDLTGTLIEMSKGGHAYSGNVRAAVPSSDDSRDHLVEELLPVDKWSNEYVVVALPNRTVGDVLRIVTAGLPATVTIYGFNADRTPLVQNIASFSHLQIQFNPTTERIMLIQADVSISVAQFTASRDQVRQEAIHDPSFLQIIPKELFTNDFQLNTPNFTGGLAAGDGSRVSRPYELNLVLVVAVGIDRLGITVGDTALSSLSDWMGAIRPTDNTPEYYAAWVPVEPGHADIFHPDPDYKFMAYAYGADDRESYGFPIKVNLTPCPPGATTVPN